mgnify:CR=1 FL=1
MVGAWVDRIAPVCAPWLPDQRRFGESRAGNSAGDSKGGRKESGACPRGYAVQSMHGYMTIGDRENGYRGFIATINATCATVEPPVVFSNFPIGNPSIDRVSPESGKLMRHSFSAACPSGELAVGLHGRSGLFVDALGLICAPAPKSKTAGAIAGVDARQREMQRPLNPKMGVGTVLGGKEECHPGFVPRRARATDNVCVTPESRDRVQQENATAASRRDPKAKGNPNACIKGFVWREAYPGDVVCVTPEIRTLVKQENGTHGIRSTSPTHRQGAIRLAP